MHECWHKKTIYTQIFEEIPSSLVQLGPYNPNISNSLYDKFLH